MGIKQQLDNNIQNQRMIDYSDLLKFEDDSPIFATEKSSNFLPLCLNNLDYDPFDEEEQYHAKCSIKQIVAQTEDRINIVDAPISNIMASIRGSYPLEASQLLQIHKILLRRKRSLKRFRAKNRKPLDTQDVSTPTMEEETDDSELKKKRNRMSAQRSRDRKKQQMRELQQKQELLQQKISEVRKQNQRLKSQIQQQKPSRSSSLGQNTFIRMLIFLGLICLVSMFKNILGLNQAKVSQSQNKYTYFEQSPFRIYYESEQLSQELQNVFESKQAADSAKIMIMNKLQEVQKGRVPSYLMKKVTDTTSLLQTQFI